MIVYFSGTGNTRSVARRLAERLGDSDVRAFTAEMLLQPASCLLEAGADDVRVIWAFPTYSWGLPPVIVNLIRNIKLGERLCALPQYMLTTCGDDMGRADVLWRKLMKARGLDARGAFSVIMPNTYVLMKGFDVDSAKLTQIKLEGSDEAIATVADAISNDGKSILRRGGFARFKTGVIYPWFRRYAMSPKPFGANAGCISCGLCASSCPMNNIVMEDGTPRWGNQCAMCLRCYHICPRHAVRYGKATDGKGQYMCPLPSAEVK